MHTGPDILATLAIVLGVAAVTTVAFQRLKLPVVFGYLLAGLIVGPHVSIPLLADSPTVHTLSELGVILLMFSLGLEFSMLRILRGGWALLIVAVLETTLMLGFGYTAARLFGWNVLQSVFAGGVVAISSTTIILKAFAEQKVTGKFTELVMGVLVFEDLIAILLLAVLTPIATSGAISAAPIGMTVVRLAAFLAAMLAVGMLVVPRLMRFVVQLQRPETTLVAAIGICFAAALLARSIGYSVALGAFLAGSLVEASGEGHRITKLVEPVRDMFVAVFFVSVGMMIEPELVMKHWGAVLAFTVLVVIGKVGAVSVSAFLTGAGTRTALQAGMSLAQIGEFSYILAGVGLAAGVMPREFSPVVVAVSAITALTTPLFIRFAEPVAAAFDKNLPRPLQTFATLHGTWIEGLREHPETTAERARMQRTLRVLATDAAVVAAIAIGASVLGSAGAERIASLTGWPVHRSFWLEIVVAAALTGPFLAGIFRSARSLGVLLADRSFSAPVSGKLDRAAAPRRGMIVAVQFTAVLVVGAPLVAVTQPFLPPFVALAGFLVALAVMGVAVWRSASNLQGHVRAAAEVVVDAIGRHARQDGPGGGETALRRAYELLPGLGEPVPVRLEKRHKAVGQKLTELELRGRTGATVIAISRGDDVVLVPDGHEALRLGDVLALAGTSDAIEAARALLERGAHD